MGDLTGRTILLVLGGGIAAYKGLETIRELMRQGARVIPVLTRGAQSFVTPLSAAALAGERAYTDLLDLTAEAEMGHIQLSREADLIVVAPATANLMARMAHGLADDLASTLLLATDTRALLAPAMNVRMWHHPATRRNLETLRADGVRLIGPGVGDMACGEHGAGRMAEPAEIAEEAARLLGQGSQKIALSAESPVEGGRARPRSARGDAPDLHGFSALVTSGPTHEPIDPVRYIANRSSGRQGHAIAQALADRGADVTLVTGPVAIPDPEGLRVVRVETAREMRDAVLARLPVDVGVFVAAVADWRSAAVAGAKRKKRPGEETLTLSLARNPDILAEVAAHADRPRLVIGFAAETEDLIANATAKIRAKGADWLVANDVSHGAGTSGAMGGARNTVSLLRRSPDGLAREDWEEMGKEEVADRLVARIAGALAGSNDGAQGGP